MNEKSRPHSKEVKKGPLARLNLLILKTLLSLHKTPEAVPTPIIDLRNSADGVFRTPGQEPKNRTILINGREVRERDLFIAE